MNLVLTLVFAAQMLSALGMIGLILVQHGKGADMGAAFGSGSSGSLFGASGSANFLSRTTAVLACIFLACTLALSYFGGPRTAAPSGSIFDRAPAAALVPAGAASTPDPASQIPSNSSAPAAADTPPPAAAPSIGASGAAQIPTR